MSLLLRRFAKPVLRACLHFMPKSRADWAKAMIREIDHIPPEDQFLYAFGCLKCSIIERSHNMLETRNILFTLPLLGCAFLALICVVNGVKFASEDTAISAVLLTAAVLWSATYCAFLFRSKIGVLRAAATGLAIYIGLGMAALTGVPAFDTNTAFLSAFAAEGVALFAITIGFAMLPILWKTAPDET